MTDPLSTKGRTANGLRRGLFPGRCGGQLNMVGLGFRHAARWETRTLLDMAADTAERLQRKPQTELRRVCPTYVTGKVSDSVDTIARKNPSKRVLREFVQVDTHHR